LYAIHIAIHAIEADGHSHCDRGRAGGSAVNGGKDMEKNRNAHNSATILITVVITLACALIVFVVLLYFGRGFLFPDQKQEAPTASLSPYPTNTPYPTYTPQPTFTLYLTPEPVWVYRYIDLYQIKVEIPSDWTIQEIDRQPTMPEFGEHDCANYLLLSRDGNSVVIIRMACGPYGGEPYPCADGTVLLDRTREIVREPHLEDNRFYYEGVYIDQEGNLWCFPSGWDLVDYFAGVDYFQWNSNYDLDTVDRIVLSIQRK
jgi:hypothetical protein